VVWNVWCVGSRLFELFFLRVSAVQQLLLQSHHRASFGWECLVCGQREFELFF